MPNVPSSNSPAAAAPGDVPLIPGNKRDDFVAAALREVGIEPVPMEGFAVWVAKLKPLLQ
jgi:hypothetical protein